MKNKNSIKLIATIFTIAILGLILFSGPAQAFILGLTIDNPSPTKGTSVTFSATLDLQAADMYLPIENLSLIITGPTLVTCVFSPSGNSISGCTGITINPIDVSSYYGFIIGGNSSGVYNGYGYDFTDGFGYGYNSGIGGDIVNLTYTITLDTTSYATGTYTSRLTALIDAQTFSSDDITFTINAVQNTGGGSSSCDEDLWTCEWGSCINNLINYTCTNDCGETNITKTNVPCIIKGTSGSSSEELEEGEQTEEELEKGFAGGV